MGVNVLDCGTTHNVPIKQYIMDVMFKLRDIGLSWSTLVNLGLGAF